MKEIEESWLDFKAIKASIDPYKVLSHFHLLEHLEERGSELVGWCPFGAEHGKDDSFSVNVEKKAFQCFACKARGSLLDLVAKLQNATLREAAHILSVIMGTGEGSEEKKIGRPYGKQSSTVEAGQGSVQEMVVADDGDIPAVMSMTVASRLIIGNKLDPAFLLVVDMRKVGLSWTNTRS